MKAYLRKLMDKIQKNLDLSLQEHSEENSTGSPPKSWSPLIKEINDWEVFHDEHVSLLPSLNGSMNLPKEIVRKSTSTKIFPALYAISTVMTLSLTFLKSCLFGQNHETGICGISNITQLPLVSPTIFQIGAICQSFFAICTYYFLYIYLQQKFSVPEFRRQYLIHRTSFFVGLVSVVFYMVFSIAPKQNTAISGNYEMSLCKLKKNTFLNLMAFSSFSLVFQETLFLNGHLACSFIFNFISLFLIFEIKRNTLVSRQEAVWINFKTAFFVLIALTHMIYIGVLAVTLLNSSVLENFNNKTVVRSYNTAFLIDLHTIITIAIFCLNTVYVSLFYFDLKFVSIKLIVQPDLDYFLDRKIRKNVL